MRVADFHIGLEFICGPFWWRCTDIGTRTVAAIRLVEDDPRWYEGPPYMVEEVVLDDTELEDGHLTEDDHIRSSLAEADASGHPGFLGEAVRRMHARLDDDCYPRRQLFRFDRVRADGEILHPYAGRRTKNGLSVFICHSRRYGERCPRLSSSGSRFQPRPICESGRID